MNMINMDKVNWNLKRILSFCFVFGLFITSYGQTKTKRFVEMTGNTDNHQPTICTRRWIHYSHQTMVDGNGVFLDYIETSTNPNRDAAYAVCDIGSRVGTRIYCDRHGDGHFSETIEVTADEVSGTVPRIYEELGCSSAWADAWVNYFDEHEFDYLHDIINNETRILGGGGTNICVSNITEDIFSVMVGEATNKYSRSSAYLVAEFEDGQRISSIYLGDTEGEYNVNFSRISGMQDIFYQNIYFRLATVFRTSYSGDFEIAGNEKIGPFVFFKAIPTPTNISVHQKACDPKVLFSMTLDNETISDLNADPNSYKFRIKNENESVSGVYKLQQYGAINGNTITLIGGAEEDDPGLIFSPEDDETYNIQIYQNVHGDETPDYNEISCATVVDVTLGQTPELLSLSATLTPYTFNSQTYHVSSAGASDGEALLSVQTELETRIDHYEYYKNGSWQTIPNDSLETRGGATYLIDLYATTYYVRVVDIDGCPSDSIDFTVVEPAPLEVTKLDSTLVNCHVNNIGQHADGQIGIHFTGGIGPYVVEVIDDTGTSVYFQDVTEEDFHEGQSFWSISTNENLQIGTYHVVVTDNSAIEDDGYIEVISNPELILSATPMPYDCYGSANGAVILRLENREELAVNYGLNGDTIYRSFVDTAYYDYLTEGIYTAGVVNSRSCKDVVEDIEIRQPNQMQINGMVSNPVCYNSFEGNISTNVTGGNGEYTYKWSNNETTPKITGLNNGSYTLVVTDVKGCTSEDIYTITPPIKPSANWVETSAVLCTGNTKTLDGGFFTAYQWKKGEEILSDERYFTLEDAGVYTLKLTNEFGCTSTDTFTLEFSNHPLDAVLLLQDSAQVSELVEVIDVTWPVPDSIGWYFDKQVSLEGNNDWSQQFSVPEEGIINVTLRAWYGGCFSDSTKNIVIYYSDEDVTNKSVEAMPLILGCKLWPNPNNGNFSLDVKLNEVAEISVFVYSLQNRAKIFSRNYKGLKKYEIPFQFNDLVTGVYLVIIKAQNEQQSIKFIINK
jgi:hypothetical protein